MSEKNDCKEDLVAASVAKLPKPNCSSTTKKQLSASCSAMLLQSLRPVNDVNDNNGDDNSLLVSKSSPASSGEFLFKKRKRSLSVSDEHLPLPEHQKGFFASKYSKADINTLLATVKKAASVSSLPKKKPLKADEKNITQSEATSLELLLRKKAGFQFFPDCTNENSLDRLEEKSRETTIEDLPFEIIVFVFSFLSFSDRVKLSVVCSVWRDASLFELRVISFSKDNPLPANTLRFLSKRCPSITRLTLPSEFAPSDFRHISDLTNLHSLEIYNSANHLDNMFHLLPSLTSLDLRCCKLLTNEALTLIASHLDDKLQVLNIHLCKRITDEGLKDLVLMKKLTVLDIGFCKRITNDGLKYISQIASLESLNLTGCEFDEVGIRLLCGMDKLRNLDISWNNVGTEGLQYIGKMSQLEALNLCLCKRITDEGLDNISGLTKLRCLNISWSKRVSDQGLKSICKLKKLEQLDMHDCSFSDNGIENLKELSSLTALGLSWNNITDLSLSHISQIKTLLSLDLHDCAFLTDEGMQHIARLSNLRCLDLSWCKISLDGVRRLSGLKRLKLLTLVGCKVSDFDVRRSDLASRSHLRVLV